MKQVTTAFLCSIMLMFSASFSSAETPQLEESADESFQGFEIEFESDSDEELEQRIEEAALKIVALSLKTIPAAIQGEISEEDQAKLEQAIEEIEALAEEREESETFSSESEEWLEEEEDQAKLEEAIEEIEALAEEREASESTVSDAEEWLEEEEESARIGHNIIVNDNFGATFDWTGFLAVLMFFSTPVIIIAVISYNRRRKREMVHNTIDKMIEQGREVPVEMLEALDKGNGAKPTFHKAVVNIAIGLGVGIFLYSVSGSSVASLALIPLFIGLAQLLIVKLEKGKSRSGGYEG